MAHELSIVIPALNEEKYIGRLLDCIARQTFQDFEVIVADTASIDRTAEVAMSYRDTFDVQVVDLGTLKGVSNARNAGAAAATGTYLLFLDADGSFPDDFLEIMVREVKRRHLNVATAQFWINSTFPPDVIVAWLVRGYVRLVEHGKHPLAGGFCIFVERKYHLLMGGFDPTYTLAEDHQYVAAVIAAGGKFAYVRKTTVIFEMRRFIEQGRVKIFYKWVSSEVYRLTHGFKVDKNYDYGFGQHKDPTEPTKPNEPKQ